MREGVLSGGSDSVLAKSYLEMDDLCFEKCCWGHGEGHCLDAEWIYAAISKAIEAGGCREDLVGLRGCLGRGSGAMHCFVFRQLFTKLGDIWV